MKITTDQSPIVLIAGHWLGAWAWDEVTGHLTAAGFRAIPMTLPGLDESDPQRATRTLDDQVAALEKVVAAANRPVVVVAHSGANAPVSVLLDRHPEVVRRVMWVDSGPVSPGTVFAPDLPDQVDEVPLPPFETLTAQASIEGLSSEVLQRFRERAVAEPGPVLRQPVTLSNDARRRVPTTLVCCSLPGAQVAELARAGHPMFAEVASLEQAEFVDLPTGHWPMWSRPAELAGLIAMASRAE